MTKRTIKTIASTAIDSITTDDIDIAIHYGNAYIMGSINSLCNNADNPQASLVRIIQLASIALAIERTKG